MSERKLLLKTYEHIISARGLGKVKLSWKLKLLSSRVWRELKFHDYSIVSQIGSLRWWWGKSLTVTQMTMTLSFERELNYGPELIWEPSFTACGPEYGKSYCQYLTNSGQDIAITKTGRKIVRIWFYY